MALPDDRNTTYTPDAPVLSQDLNDLQDAVINGAHGEVVEQYSPIISNRTNANVTGSGTVLTASSGASVQVAVVARVGDVLKGVTYRLLGNGAADVTAAKLIKVSASGVASALGDDPQTNPPASWATYAIDIDARPAGRRDRGRRRGLARAEHKH